ncbi:MAG: DnaD domain protein [Lagierella massiliensis]|nr:DnaD domain protein [Lagierella massiliensis]
MTFKIDEFNIDLGETSIENLFLDLFMPLASGDDVKVYLYLFRQVKKLGNGFKYDKKLISRDLNMTEDEIEKSLKHWLEEGIIKRELNPMTKEYNYTFLSIRELQLGQKTFYEYDKRDDNPMSLNENQQMFNWIEEFLQVPLGVNPINEITELQQETGIESELIKKAFQYSFEKRGKKNPNYVMGILKNWVADGITSVEDFEKMENEEKTRRKNIKKRRSYYKPSNNEQANKNTEKSPEMMNLIKKLQDKKRNLNDE